MAKRKQVTETGFRHGDVVVLLGEIKTLLNECKAGSNNIKANLDAFYAKIDADAGVTDTDYAAVLGTGGSDDDALTAVISTSDIALVD